jgi:hypothetical protein
VFVHALSGAASFAACLRLFRSYPLAVTAARTDDPRPAPATRPPADTRPADTRPAGREREQRGPDHPGPATSRPVSGTSRAMVLRHRGFDGSGYHVLTQDPAGHFTLRPWLPGEGARQEIRPGVPVPVTCHRVITEGMPVPRDGALLGWVSDRQATVLLSVFHGRPAGRPGVPQVRVLAQVGTEPVRWPSFTASPLDDGRLWEYVERAEIVDLAPVFARSGEAAWVPSQNTARARQGHGCVVVSHSLVTEEFWVPSGTYMDHWMLREGVPTPPAGHLLTLPGVTDLASRVGPGVAVSAG